MLFSSAFSIAYFAMLRVNELAVKSSSDESGHALNYENVKLTKLNGENELYIEICKNECIKRFNKWNDIGVRTSNFEGLFRRRPSNILHTMKDFVLSVRFLIIRWLQIHGKHIQQRVEAFIQFHLIYKFGNIWPASVDEFAIFMPPRRFFVYYVHDGLIIHMDN
jgi:hypothetical protein